MSLPSEISICLYSLATVAAEAGMLILDTAGSANAVETKEDGTPVSRADLAAHTHILEKLGQLYPQIAVVSEEMPAGQWPDTCAQPFFLVDPLDGTKEFLAGKTDYTVNIALIQQGQPVAGIVHAPALGLTYVGSIAQGAAKAATGIGILPESHDFIAIQTRFLPDHNRIAYASRSHRTPETEELLGLALKGESTVMPRIDRVDIVGSSLKFVKIAEGLGDFYPRCGITREWDTAAGHAVLLAAGGKVTTFAGEPLLYGKKSKNFINEGFMAQG